MAVFAFASKYVGPQSYLSSRKPHQAGIQTKLVVAPGTSFILLVWSSVSVGVAFTKSPQAGAEQNRQIRYYSAHIPKKSKS
jgi:hypothetical protein